MTSRFYCGENQELSVDTLVQLPPEESRHLLKTLRGKVGDTVIVFRKGQQFRGEIAGIENGVASVRLQTEEAFPPPTTVATTCLIPWIKGGKTDYLVQKLTELGVAQIGVFQATREVARGDASKLDRLQKIALEACKQCERVDIPPLFTATSLRDGIATVRANIAHAPVAILHERAGSISLRELVSPSAPPRHLVLASGPEGGWDARDLADLPDQGTHFVTIGKRILRAETAPLAALSAVLTLSGDF